METILEEVNSLVGVSGSFVCNDQGVVLASVVETDVNKSDLPDVGTILLKTLKGLISISGRDHIELDLVYDDHRVLVRKIEDGCLCILSVREVNLPILHASADRAMERLERSVEVFSSNLGDKDLSEIIEKMKAIVDENLGTHADKVIKMIDESSESRESLESVCDEIEDATRLFIDKKKSKEMTAAMRALLEEEGTS